MPETRLSAQADAITALTTGLTDLNIRTQGMESLLQQQMEELARNSANVDRVLQLYESLDGTVHAIQRGPRPDKRPMGSSDSSPLLPTPLTTTVGDSGNHPANSTPVIQRTDQPDVPRIDHPNYIRREHMDMTYQLERYFEHHSVPPGQHMMVATFHIAGEALKWFQWMHATHQIIDWPSFARDLLSRFGPSAYTHPEVAINQLIQTGPLVDYIREFETLSTRTPGLSAANLLHRFIAGLRPDIKREIILLCPPTLQLAMGMARVADEKIQEARALLMRPYHPTPFSSNHYTPRPPNTTTYTKPHPPHTATPTSPTNPTIPTRKLTPAQMASRRAQGLCFNCDECFNPGHKCKLLFQCYVLNDDDCEPTTDTLLTDPSPAECAKDMIPSISFHAMQGSHIPSTLRIQGWLGGQQVTILIDGGSTHNFLQARLAKHAGLTVELIRHLNVVVGNGDQLQCDGVCRDVGITLDGHAFQVDFHLLSIYGADAVLGAQWLAEVGPTLFDYRELWMSFIHNGVQVKLRGMSSTAQFSQLSLGQLQRATNTHAVATFYQLTCTPVDPAADYNAQSPLPILPDHLDPHQQQSLLKKICQCVHFPPRPTPYQTLRPPCPIVAWYLTSQRQALSLSEVPET
ncbi:unnamed protein product [Rhodiola kirilowii]